MWLNDDDDDDEHSAQKRASCCKTASKSPDLYPDFVPLHGPSPRPRLLIDRFPGLPLAPARNSTYRDSWSFQDFFAGVMVVNACDRGRDYACTSRYTTVTRDMRDLGRLYSFGYNTRNSPSCHNCYGWSRIYISNAARYATILPLAHNMQSSSGCSKWKPFSAAEVPAERKVTTTPTLTATQLRSLNSHGDSSPRRRPM